MRTIVCNTGPLLHLREAGLLSLLREAGTLIIPEAVDDELSGIDTPWGMTGLAG